MNEHLPRHRIERVRQELKRRNLTVAAVTDITPRMRRIELVSTELADFSSLSPDDHIKLFLPDAGAAGGMSLRDYTPRRFDADACRLTLDFALHESGPAATWAKAAQPGDLLTIGGPKGSVIVPDDFDHYLLVGDETALPSIGRRVEALRASVPVTVVAIVEDLSEAQHFDSSARLDLRWVARASQRGAAGADDAALLRAALDQWQAPRGDGYVWIAAEAKVARALKTYMLEERGHPPAWLKASGYWVRGEAGATDKLES